MAEIGLRMVPKSRNPYFSAAVGNASFTIGTESGDAITVAVQLRDSRYKELARRGSVRAFLAGDANGDTIVPTAPTTVAAGTDGVLIPLADLNNGVLVAGTLAIDATPEKFKTTTTLAYVIGGKVFTKAATTAIAFSAAHVVAATKYGIVLVQINAAGTISTKVPAATPTTPMTYADAATALAALPAPDSGNVAVGYITLDNSGSDGSSTGAWVGITDDLTDTSDITDSGFVDASLAGLTPRVFDLISESDGDIDVVITKAGAYTCYLALILPDGTLVVSNAITLAA